MSKRNPNSNEKADRNQMIFQEREKGLSVVQLSQKYGLSMPRIHRICMKEENKVLRKKNAELMAQLEMCELDE